MARNKFHIIASSFLAVTMLSACSLLTAQNAPTSDPGQPVATQPSPTSQPTTASLLVTVPTHIAQPEPPPTSTPSETLPVPEATPTLQMVQVYLIGLEDNGVSGVKIGCGDSAIAIQVPIPPTQGVLIAAYTKLLAIKDRIYGGSGLYNALYQSDLQVSSVTIKDGTAIVYLTGSLMMGGECDIPRVQAQLEQTALQFSTVKSVAVYINGKPLKDVLSLK